MTNNIFKTAESALKNANIRFRTEDDRIFRLRMGTDNIFYDVCIVCDEEKELLLTIVTASLRVPDEKLDKMCRWLVEKNYGLTLGEFKLDVNDGELSFRTSCPLDDGAVNERIVQIAVWNSVGTFDRNYEEIAKILFKNDMSDEEYLSKLMIDSVNGKYSEDDVIDTGSKKKLCS